MTAIVLLALLGSAFATTTQDPGAVSQQDVDQAIHRGVEHLKGAPSGADWLHPNCDELILLTLVAADVPPTDPVLAKYLKSCLQAPLEKTYKVSCLAMALEELDASAYQMKIAQCAQFLVDNQTANGQWSYGAPTDVSRYAFEEKEKVETGGRGAAVRDFGAARERRKPTRSVVVVQQRTHGETGDNSNSQYAALGLRACHDANVKIPLHVVHLARKWWVESQWPDESGARGGRNAVASGTTGRVQGWSYLRPGLEDQKAPTHSMTAGAIGSTVIYQHLLGKDWKKDPVTQAGVNWLAKHFTVSDHLYYMYAVERAGILYGTSKFGDRDWYQEGARFLLGSQNADGSWGKHEKAEKVSWDTCFAILFLKKATRAIATGDRK